MLCEDNNVKKHVLITSLSKNPWDAVYSLYGKTAKANQSPLALMQLLPPKSLPQQIIVLCTKALEEQFDQVKELMETGSSAGIGGGSGVGTDMQITVRSLSIPDGKTTEELWQILHLILGAVPPGCRLTLDLTHGFRTYPFLFFTAAMFLKALHNVQIEAVYYGMFDTPGDEKPIVDLSLILDMVEWFYATRTFVETGQASHITKLLVPFENRPEGLTGPACRPYSMVKTLRESFDATAAAYVQALPVEFGFEAAKLLNKLAEPAPEHLRDKMPLPDELFGKISSFIEPFALHLSNWRQGKTTLPLYGAELMRQAAIIDTYLEQGYVNYAVGLIREWIVSAAMFHKERVMNRKLVDGKQWLSYSGEKGRKTVEWQLGTLAKLTEDTGKKVTRNHLTKGQAWLARHWVFLRDRRNDLHHHGFKEDNALLNQEKMNEIKDRWQEIKNSLGDKKKWSLGPAMPDEPEGKSPARLESRAKTHPERRTGTVSDKPANGGNGRSTLLVSPLGMSKGLLYSALRHIQPHQLFVITSTNAAGSFYEITQKSGWSGKSTIRHMQDPHSGFDEAESIALAALPATLQADQVVVNITGGTTAMQHIVQQIAVHAKEHGCPVRRAALVDRRTPQEQRDNPYVTGELIWLDGEKEE